MSKPNSYVIRNVLRLMGAGRHLTTTHTFLDGGREAVKASLEAYGLDAMAVNLRTVQALRRHRWVQVLRIDPLADGQVVTYALTPDGQGWANLFNM